MSNDTQDYPLTIAVLRERLALAEALADAVEALLNDAGYVMTRVGTKDCPAEYIGTHEERDAKALYEALVAWHRSAKV
jgi:hypothetical protein